MFMSATALASALVVVRFVAFRRTNVIDPWFWKVAEMISIDRHAGLVLVFTLVGEGALLGLVGTLAEQASQRVGASQHVARILAVVIIVSLQLIGLRETGL